MSDFRIEARALSLGGVAAHDYWVLRDGSGRVLAEMHGLSTDRETGKSLAIGTDEDRHSLRAWHLVHDVSLAKSFSVPKASRTFLEEDQARMTILVGPEQEVLARWKAAVDSMPTLNALDRDYPGFGFKLDGSTVNSNSTYRTLGEIMGLPIRDFRGYVEPGIENRMVSPAVIEQLRVKGYPQLTEPSINTGDGYRPLRDEPKTLWNRHDDPVFRQTLAAVHALDAGLGRAPDEASDRMATNLAALARNRGLERVDHVVLSIDNGRVRAGENVFVVQGGLTEATNRVAFMKTDEALLPPGCEASRALAMDRAPRMAVSITADAESPSHSALSRSI